MTPLDRANLEILQLKEKLETITEERDDLRKIVLGRKDEDEYLLLMATFNFTPTETRLVQALYSVDRPMSKNALLDSLYDGRDIDEQPEGKILEVLVCKARKKMGAGEYIKTIWGRGYEMTDAGRQALTARMEALMARRAA